MKSERRIGMNIKKLNSYMIIYVFLDYIYFIKQLYRNTDSVDEKNKIMNDIETIEYYIVIYLKHSIGTKDLHLFLNELNHQYKNK